MHPSVIVLCGLFAATTTAFPQDLPVVRPNHYLSQGTFAKENHLLPNSFYTPGQQVADELRSIHSAPVSQQGARGTRALQQQEQQQASAPKAASEQVASSSSAESASQDSYANIGGFSGRIASALTNTDEYGETVPQAFSNLQQDSYAYYHGHKA